MAFGGVRGDLGRQVVTAVLDPHWSCDRSSVRSQSVPYWYSRAVTRRELGDDEWALVEPLLPVGALCMPKISPVQVRGILGLVEHAVVVIASSYVEEVDLVRVGDRCGQRVRR